MKYRVLAVIVMLITLFSITVNASGYEYSITPSDDFISAQHGDDLNEISKKLNMSESELSSYFNQNGLLYLAVSDDGKSQIKLSAFTDNFSSAAGDIANLDDTGLSEFVSAVGEGSDQNADIVLNNGRKFVCIKNIRKDSGGVYTVTQYITICNSKTFYFAGYNEGEDTSDKILSAFQSFKLSEKQAQSTNYTLPLIFVIIGIVIFTSISIVMIIGIIKSKRNKE